MAFDFEGARRICEAICEQRPEYLAGQPETISRIAAGLIALDRQEYDDAIENFRRVSHLEITTKFFLHWVWRMMAQLESSNALLLSGDIAHAGMAAREFFDSALSTADPHLQALAWELKTRVAMAENELKSAQEYIERSLAIVDKFEILIAAWQVHATAWQLRAHAGELETAEVHRERAESCILKIADSFAPEEPLRATFLAAVPVRRILHDRAANRQSVG